MRTLSVSSGFGRRYGAAAFCLAILGSRAAALADDKPVGELWQQSVTIEMTGMSMPPHTTDICVPPGKANEALSKPQAPGMTGECTIQDARQEGNRFTARFTCNGKPPAQGTIESIVEGDHARGTITLTMSGQQPMIVKSDAHKVGTACTPEGVPGTR